MIPKVKTWRVRVMLPHGIDAWHVLAPTRLLARMTFRQYAGPCGRILSIGTLRNDRQQVAARFVRTESYRETT